MFSLKFMRIMTAQEMELQKIYESEVELPTNPDEMKKFLEPEELERRNLPFPETDFVLPEVGNCCREIIKVFYYPLEGDQLFVRLKTDQELNEFHEQLCEAINEVFGISETSSPAFDSSISDEEFLENSYVNHEKTEAWVKREDVSLAEWLGLWNLVIYPH